MRPDLGRAAQRRAVTERLRRFFAALTAQLAAGTAEIWSRVERQTTSRVVEPVRDESTRDESLRDDVTAPPPPMRSPMQQQPLQQQQQKITPPDDK